MSSRARPRLTYDDYLLLPDDGKRHEILDGDHVVNAAPSLRHQTISGRIHAQLWPLVEETGRGSVYAAPVDVHLSEFDVVQPDLVVVLEARSGILATTKIAGAPDLLLEILSPSTASIDRDLKRKLYERAGVPEYWIVDPDAEVVERHVLEGARYRLAGRTSDAVAFGGLDDVVVDLGRVW